MHIGTDLVHIPTFRTQLATPGTTFTRAFTDRELRDCAAKPDRDASLAARWAAKEAYIKAWGSSRFGRPPALATLDLRQLEVLIDAHSRPTLALHPQLAAAGAPEVASLSLSHDGDYATATCLVDTA